MRRLRSCRNNQNCEDLTDERDCDESDDCNSFTEWVEVNRNATHIEYERSCLGELGHPGCVGETEKVESLDGRHQRRLTSSVSCFSHCKQFSQWTTFRPDQSFTFMTRKRYCLNNYECEVIDTLPCDGNKCIYWEEWSEWELGENRIDNRIRICVDGNPGDKNYPGNQKVRLVASVNVNESDIAFMATLAKVQIFKTTFVNNTAVQV